jgi:NAD(P)-dependent dehydrogenase (short-subunit alcohol dehydrogenase family)
MKTRRLDLSCQDREDVMNGSIIEGHDWLDLKGRVCVVTGAGSGIGAQAAKQLASAGAYVAVLDKNIAAAQEVANSILKVGLRAIAIEVDVASREQAIDAADRVQSELGACNVLINNAAMSSGAPLLQVELDDWNRVLGVNLTGALLCIQAFGPQLISAGSEASVINVGSITGAHAMPFAGAYSVSKAALSMLTRVLMLELAPHRVRVNTLVPGLVRTPATERSYQDSGIAEKRRSMVPSGREGQIDDLANVIMMLASRRSAYINGQEIYVDGGLSQSLMNFMPRAGVSRGD